MTQHVVNDVPYKTADGAYQMVVEIPAGTREKWQADAVTGEFYHDKIDGVPRIINFLSYPMNYGFVPQTILLKSKGGDGDPTDIITLGDSHPRGSILPCRVIGSLLLAERGEIDNKIVALLPDSAFADVDDMPGMLMKYPEAMEILRRWFEGYKGSGAFTFKGYADKAEAIAFIEETHAGWETLKQL